MQPRPDIQEFASVLNENYWKNAGMFNLFRLWKILFNRNNIVLLVPTPLHINISIVNQIIQSLGLVVTKPRLENGLDDYVNFCLSDLLSASLWKGGARRERYNRVDLSGEPFSRAVLSKDK